MSDTNAIEEPKKQGLASKIAWGAMIAGATVAVAAVVGFIFAPVPTYQLIESAATGIANLFCEPAEAATKAKGFLDAVIGKFDVTKVNALVDGQGAAAVARAQEAVTAAEGTLHTATAAAAQEVQTLGAGVSRISAAQEALTTATNNLVATQSLSDLRAAAEINGGWFTSASSALSGRETAIASALKESVAKSTGLINFITHHGIISGAAAFLGATGIYNAVTDDSAEIAAKEAPRKREALESFAMQHDMRKMQTVMALRAAAAGHPQAQAFLAQGQGR